MSAPSAARRVFFTVFAGRQRYLSVLRRYLDRLLAAGALHEVHLWDFTHNAQDKAYVAALAAAPGYRLFVPASRPHQNAWGDYYRHYAAALDQDAAAPQDPQDDAQDGPRYRPHDLLVKCDDDVVFLDEAAFPAFAAAVQHGTLHFPDLVNNDVCAHLQSAAARLHHLLPAVAPERALPGFPQPLSDWYTRHDAAAAAHAHFLSPAGGPRNYAAAFAAAPGAAPGAIPWPARISINLFAATMQTAAHAFRLFDASSLPGDHDERFLSADLCAMLQRPNLVLPGLTAVHFAFAPQDAPRLDAAFLPAYDALSRRDPGKAHEPK